MSCDKKCVLPNLMDLYIIVSIGTGRVVIKPLVGADHETLLHRYSHDQRAADWRREFMSSKRANAAAKYCDRCRCQARPSHLHSEEKYHGRTVGVGDGVGVGFGGSSGSAVGRGVGVGDGVAVGVGTRRGVGVGAAEMLSGVELPTCVSASPEMTRMVAINNGPIFFNIRPPYSVNTGAISGNGRALTGHLGVKDRSYPWSSEHKARTYGRRSAVSNKILCLPKDRI